MSSNQKPTQEAVMAKQERGKVVIDVSMSLDRFIAGTDDSPEQPLGVGGDRLIWKDMSSPLP